MKRACLLLILLAVLTACSSDRMIGVGDWPDDQPRRVLFVGNSHTYSGGGVNRYIENLVKAAHPDWEVHFGALVEGGFTLKDHYSVMEQQVIRQGEWDVVVLQENSRVSAYEPESFYEYARLFDELIREEEAGVCFFMVHSWYNDNDMFQRTEANYAHIAGELDAALAPVGVAWANALLQNSDLELYASDHYHPAVAGAYLSACVIYATLYGESPENIDWRPNQISEEDAALLRAVAWQTTQDYNTDTQ